MIRKVDSVFAERLAAGVTRAGGQRLLARNADGILDLAVTIVRDFIGVDVAFIGAFDDEDQVYVAVASTDGFPMIAHGGFTPRAETVCERVINDDAPAVIRDTTMEEATADLPAVREGTVRSYIGVPITYDGGRLYGTLCGVGREPSVHLSERDVQLMEGIAAAVSAFVERERVFALATQARADTFARVVHDLRSPLQAILGYAALLETAPKPNPRFAATIAAEAGRLNDMLSELLDEQQAQLQPVATSTFDASALVREQCATFDGQSEQHTIRNCAPAAPMFARGDRVRAGAALANLLSNAIKYSPAGGAVTVEVKTNDGAMRIIVTDNGIGIPAEEQRGIFTRFFRTSTTRSSGVAGTGLGLALARESLRQFGGDIGFASHEGEGSSFWIEMPAAQEQ